MEMLQIVLIRPGATDYDRQGRIQGALDIPLNEEGTGEVQRLAANLKDLGIESVYCSASESARQTAGAIAGALHVKLKEMKNMQNLNQGLWQGMLIDDVRRKQPKVYRQWQEQPETICPPDGETLGEAKQRVHEAIGKLLKKHRSGVVAMVVPEPLASLVRARLGPKELGDLWEAAAEHGSWEVIRVGPQSVASRA